MKRLGAIACAIDAKARMLLQILDQEQTDRIVILDYQHVSVSHGATRV
jgi:hypothetical protein